MNTPITDILKEKRKQLNGSSTMDDLIEKIEPIEQKQQKYIIELEQHQHPKYYHENSIN